ncbi:Uracil phosphoribosyltransferase [Poriferisphaera corsica]|uniref:Uracil phosphoribosyltransferase n=2 Tax=Poriferisphaera corsica TaxID=2528020 RepID=A0A517YU12_9BACT|nr:uracil phosphoribosyltransferase [Poriferisphaera corsica]QDU33711.1 Uracil phosphoribosyltransferase [Poriferisphaera corsica]
MPYGTMLQVIKHPLIDHYLTRIRDIDTSCARFRDLVGCVGTLLAYEATRDVKQEEVEVQTPMEKCTGLRFANNVCIVPILRAGIGFSDAIVSLFPDAHIGHIGLFRNEDILEPVEYYKSLPIQIGQGPVLLVDPMLATGGSAIAAAKMLKEKGCKDIRFICLIAAPEGIEKFHIAHPDVPIYTAAVDRQLDENGYILPGLGDAGDRIFGTLEKH